MRGDRRLSIRDILTLAPVIPVLVIDDLAQAALLARALQAGGLPVLEVTLRSTAALRAIELMRTAVPNAIVGAGTLTRPQDFKSAEAAGAQFGVTPGLTPALAEAASHVSFPLLPGIATPAEIIAAREFGYDTLKFFPAEPAGGTAMLAAFAGPFPEVRFCPTGGITRERAPSYLQQPNVLCVGGSWVAPRVSLQRGDWAEIEHLAREAAALARQRSHA
jgi:2-dehydro-3-deoxyphosphogluconate aldolase/(4S)-4-hydroxy-2-oxoglutarate aldolase